MLGDFPRTADEMTPKWLSEALGNRVIGFETTKVEGGALSDVFRLHSITYQNEGADAPPSVILKVAHSIPEQRALALSVNAYLKELRFFEDLASDVPLQTPRLYASASDGSPQAEWFLLLLEDLGLHSKSFDQVDDPPSAAFARKLALEAAELHAQYWESPTVRLPWLAAEDGRYRGGLDAMARAAPTGWQTVRPLWKQMMGTDLFDTATDGDLEQLSELLGGPRSGAILDRISEILTSRPWTVLHGDMRADNIFRTDPALGKTVEGSSLTVIDWQLMHAGPPGADLTVAWMGSLEPDAQRQQRDMLQQYHARLLALQPDAAAYTYEMLEEDYALSGCVYWAAVVLGAFPTILRTFDQPGTERMKGLFHAALPRLKVALLDLDCLARIERICATLPEDGSVVP